MIITLSELGISSCKYTYSTYLNQYYGQIITGDLGIITYSELRKIISKGSNYREPSTINRKRFKENILDNLDRLITSNICYPKGL